MADPGVRHFFYTRPYHLCVEVGEVGRPQGRRPLDLRGIAAGAPVRVQGGILSRRGNEKT
jgi:hypothetical protein